MRNLKLSAKHGALIVAGVALLGLGLFAPGSSSSLPDGTPSFGSLIARAGGSLMVILALLLGVVYFARRYGLAPGVRSGGDGRLRVEEQVGLAGRQTLYVVRYSSQRYLVGSGQQGVSLVARIRETPRPASSDVMEQTLK